MYVTLNGNKNIEASIGKYSELGVKKVSFNKMQVTSSSTILYYLDDVEYTSMMALESAVNAISSPKKVTIKYVAQYDGETGSVSRTVNLK